MHMFFYLQLPQDPSEFIAEKSTVYQKRKKVILIIYFCNVALGWTWKWQWLVIPKPNCREIHRKRQNKRSSYTQTHDLLCLITSYIAKCSAFVSIFSFLGISTAYKGTWHHVFASLLLEKAGKTFHYCCMWSAAPQIDKHSHIGSSVVFFVQKVVKCHFWECDL